MRMGLGSLLQKYSEISCTRVKLTAMAKQQLSLLQKLSLILFFMTYHATCLTIILTNNL